MSLYSQMYQQETNTAEQKELLKSRIVEQPQDILV